MILRKLVEVIEEEGGGTEERRGHTLKRS